MNSGHIYIMLLHQGTPVPMAAPTYNTKENVYFFY